MATPVPCPDCGGEISIHEFDGGRGSGGATMYVASCSCGYRLEHIPSNCTGRKRDAIAEYNREVKRLKRGGGERPLKPRVPIKRESPLEAEIQAQARVIASYLEKLAEAREAVAPLLMQITGDRFAVGAIIEDYRRNGGKHGSGHLRGSVRVKVIKSWPRVHTSVFTMSTIAVKCIPLRDDGSELKGEAYIEFPIFRDISVSLREDLPSDAQIIHEAVMQYESGKTVAAQ
jgi:hypothetical protein